MTTLDPRLTPARPDLAAERLRGTVAADRYVEGRRMQVTAALLDLRRHPRSDAALDTQLLHGETLRSYDEEDGWAWVEAERDGYVGYVATHGLSDTIRDGTHQVAVARTFVYPAPDMKQPVRDALPLGSRVAVVSNDRFAKLASGGWVFGAHLAPLDRRVTHDIVTTAEQLVGVPYLWGGRSPQGIDCSGLVQLSFAMAGIDLPRDTHMQQALGEAVSPDGPLRRGDLVFWRGHVGIMRDADTMVHANGHHMLVHCESLRDARDRIAAGADGVPVSAVRRFAY